MLLLSGNDMEELLDIGRSIEELRAAFKEQSLGQVQMPPRQTTDAQDGQNWLRISSAFLNGSGFMGFKAMNRAAGLGMRYMVGLYRIETGELVAIMDANWLTTRRTAATNAIGTDLLAPVGETTLGVIGAGVQAHALLEAYSTLRHLTHVTVYSPRQESREDFAKWIREKLNIDATTKDSAEAVAKASSVTVLAMRAPREPVYKANWLRPGIHITGLSSVRFDAREIEDDVWKKSDVIVVDDISSVFQSGDGKSVEASGFDRYQVSELWKLTNGDITRTNADQVTLFKSSGHAIQDIAVAIGVYKLAIERKIGTEIIDFPEIKPYD